MTCPCRPICLVPKTGCDRSAVHQGTKVPLAALAQAVQALPLFEGLSREVIQNLLGDAVVMMPPRGLNLFEAGSEADAFYIVVEGQVKLYALTPDGRESIVEVFAAGSSFGEAAMLSGGAFPLSAEIIEDAALVRVGRRAFIACLRADPAVARTLIAALTRWNRRLDMEILTLKQSEPWQRVAAYLLALAGKGTGPAVVELPFNKEVLASRVGICRESLSRVFSRLRTLGVETDGASVRIKDVGALRAAATRSNG